MTNEKRLLKVFICHASADKLKVHELYAYLRRRGIQPWLDTKNLLPGQTWQVEILRALETSDAIIICLSKGSVDKEGYVQKEIKFALDKALEIPEGHIFLIPARLEECDIPRSLSSYHWVDLFDESSYKKLMKSLRLRAAQFQTSNLQTPKADESSSGLSEKLKENIPVQIKGDILGNEKAIQTPVIQPAIIAPQEMPVTRAKVEPRKSDPIQNQQQKEPNQPVSESKVTCLLRVAIAMFVIFSIIMIKFAPLFVQTPQPTPILTNTSPILTLTPDSTDTPFPTPSLTMTPSQTPTMQVCPYQRATDDGTIVALIQAETVAAQQKDMVILQDIFDPEAIFYDYAFKPVKIWQGVEARYPQDLFIWVDFKDGKHFDILPAWPGISGDTATYTSGSEVTYKIGSGPWTHQINGSAKSTKYGSEHWILKKNPNGCWVITQMEFNAGLIKFP
jgi:hypothetical protein